MSETTAMSDLMNPDLALGRLLEQAVPVRDSETLATADALGRVLAQPVTARVTVPPADNSAVDGYAIRWQDARQDNPLPLSQRIPAGDDPQPLRPGTAARIFTGAAIPPGADTVLMQEHCQEDSQGQHVTLNKPPQQGQNIRPAGQDIRAGEPLLEAGTRLLPQHLGLLASVGLAEVNVHRRLRVAILSTGDELVSPGEPLAPGKIYNSNRFLLKGLLESARCDILDLGDVADSFQATCDALANGAADADLIISTGGVSVGDEDHVRSAVQSLGRLDLWRLAIKPGKPFAFGQVGATPFVGLPGNPAAVLV
ncbi:MAG: molybdopterin molybdotransferase MoeA, partial [Oleiphilaceae bacterium]|nr:molybdopterin molybdotransferase MoeA [Oleiphilaceae bacterium]